MDSYLAAAVQMQSGPDRDANLDRARALIAEAAAHDVRLVVLPEVSSWRGPRADEAAHFEPVPGPTTEAMAELAATHKLYLCLGSLLEATRTPGRAYNTACLLGPNGDLLGAYRKIHLFDVDIAGGVSVAESETRIAGEDPVAIETELGTMGLSICYDLRFPELYRRLVAAGADVLLVPSAFTAHTGSAHWEVLCRARAIESQCYVLAANQTGASPYGFDDYGNSMIVDPWGTVLGRAAEGERVVIGKIDRAHLARVRTQLPSLQHMRLPR